MDSKKSTLQSNDNNEKEKELRSIINSDKSKAFNHNGKRYWVGKKIKEELKSKINEEKEGGLIPLIPILAGLASAATIAGGVATTVAKSKEAQKNAAEIEKIENNNGDGLYLNNNNNIGKGIFLGNYKGKGIFLDNYKGKGISDFLKEHVKISDLSDNDKKIIIQVLKTLKNGCKCKVKEGKRGNGIFLKPFTANS